MCHQLLPQLHQLAVGALPGGRQYNGRVERPGVSARTSTRRCRS